MKRTPLVFMLLLILVTTSASSMGKNEARSSALNISVSFVGKEGAIAHNFRTSEVFSINSETSSLTDETYFKPERQTRVRGNLVACNPVITHFIIRPEPINLYTTKYTKQIYPVTAANDSSGGGIPRHFDLVYAKNITRECKIDQARWEGLFWGFNPNNTYSNADAGQFYLLSIIAVNLGPDYDGIPLPGELQGALKLGGQTISFPVQTGIHYFSFQYLHPYTCPNLSTFIIGEDISANEIQNPLGRSGRFDVRGGHVSDGNSSLLCLTGYPLDFSGKSNPAVVFYWDLSHTIEVYDRGTPDDRNDDIVTLRLDNPFPVTVEVVEESEVTPPPASNTSDSPEDVLFPMITGKGYNAIQWVNPNTPSFEKTVIIRKADSAPTSNDDGEIVFEGYPPNYCDQTGKHKTHYYYRIYTVNFSGGRSDGIVLDKVQP
ncbi:MAG TPA: hypothetical protein VHY08_19680 [Bacillota bacterium]|nr:hypothetical protein [Bacillota bacterium]